jgi:hypothetical protein
MSFRSLKNLGLGFLIGLGLAGAAEAKMYDPTGGQADKIAEEKESTTDKILRQCSEYELARLVAHDVQEMVRLEVLLDRQMIPSSVEAACESFTTTTTIQSLTDLTKFSNSLELSISKAREIQQNAEATYASQIWAQAETRKDENQLFSKQKFIANKKAILTYRTLVSRLDRLQELLETRPYEVQTQTIDLEARRTQLRTIFANYYGSSENFIGDDKEELHYLTATRARKLQQELLTLSGDAYGGGDLLSTIHLANSNSITVLEQMVVESEGRYNRALKEEAIRVEGVFASGIVRNKGVIFLTEQEREENLTQINSLLDQERIQPLRTSDGTRGYRLNNLPVRKAEMLANIQGHLVYPEEEFAELTQIGGDSTITVITPIQTEELQPTIIPITTANLTERDIVELLEDFEGKTYGSYTLQKEALSTVDLWGATAALGKMYGYDSMGAKANRKLRHELLNHSPNLQILQNNGMGPEFKEYSPYRENNSEENGIALEAILSGQIALTIPNTEVLEHMQRLASKETLTTQDLIQAQALIRTIKERGLENQISFASNLQPTHNLLNMSQEQIQYNEQMGKTLSGYEKSGSGLVKEVVESINHYRDQGNVVSRFNKKALEKSGDIGFAYNLLADSERTIEQKISDLEQSLNMSISNSHAGRMIKEAETYMQQCANEEAITELTPNEKVNPAELAEMVEEKAYKATTPKQTYSSLPTKRTQKAAA